MAKTSTTPNPGASDVLDEVKELLLERGTKYGPASEHFYRTCCLLEIVFPQEKLQLMLDRSIEGALPFTKSDWALIMICDKLARLSNPNTLGSNVHTDTIDDIVGYAALLRDLYEDEHGS